MYIRPNSIAKGVLVSIAIAAFLTPAITLAGFRSFLDYCPVGCQQFSCDPGSPPQTPSARSYDDFVRQAYVGAYGRLATCAERQAEVGLLEDAAAGGTVPAEAARFVSTLFETQGSYDVQDLCTYTQTSAYDQRNPQSNTDRTSIESFVADLYRAFLQREPDAPGQCFWSNDVCAEGRKKGIIAFVASIEFGSLVGGLYDSGPVCCPHHCPPGYFWDCDFGYCVPQ